MSKVQVDTIDTRSGTSTMQIGSTNTTTINLGVSGDTVNIPSGVTIANAGTATGFGESNTPAFRVRSSAGQSISNTTWTKIEFDAEDKDTDSAFDLSNERFTVPSGEGGLYFFQWSIENNGKVARLCSTVSIQMRFGRLCSTVSEHLIRVKSARHKLEIDVATAPILPGVCRGRAEWRISFQHWLAELVAIVGAGYERFFDQHLPSSPDAFGNSFSCPRR